MTHTPDNPPACPATCPKCGIELGWCSGFIGEKDCRIRELESKLSAAERDLTVVVKIVGRIVRNMGVTINGHLVQHELRGDNPAVWLCDDREFETSEAAIRSALTPKA